MMKIERLLSISQDKKGNEIARVQDLTKEQIKNIPKDKFRKAKSQRKEGRLESEIYIIFKEDFDDLENNISKIQSLEAELEEKNQTIKKLEDGLSAIDEDHQKEMENIKQDNSAKVKALKDDLHDKDLEIERVKTEYEKQIGNLKEEHSANIDELKNGLHEKDIELEKTKTEYETEIGELKEKYERELGDFKEKIQKEINHLQLFDEDKHMKIQDHNDKVSELKKTQFNSEYHMKIQDHKNKLNEIKDTIIRETIVNNDNINELEKGLTIGGFIRGKYKTPLNDLKEGIDHIQYIAQYSETYENQVFNVNKKKKEDK